MTAPAPIACPPAPGRDGDGGLVLAERFKERANRCTDRRELQLLLEEATLELGFQYFALLHHRTVRPGSDRLIRIDNYPKAWEQELLASHDVALDPVHLASLRANAGFGWDELGDMLSLGSGQRRILERSRHHGLGPGFTIPANVPGEPSGSCSFAVGPDCALPSRQLTSAELIGAQAFAAARRIYGFVRIAPLPRLSPRERQCLGLVAAGKTDWEIAAILGIAVETARQYVKRARAAYDVVSRAQLVACGLRDSLISFDQAIPPAG